MTINKMKIKSLYLFTITALLSIVSCSDDDAIELPIPTLMNIEVGLNNNEIGVLIVTFTSTQILLQVIRLIWYK